MLNIKAEVASGEFKILNLPGLDLVGQSYIVYSKKRPLSALAQEFLEMLRGEATKKPAKPNARGLRRSEQSRAVLI